MGAPAELIEQLAAEPAKFEVWPCNIEALDAFLAIATQWRTERVGEGQVHWLGLDYTAVRSGWAMAGLRVPPATWGRVQTIERAAAAALNGAAG